MDDEIHSGSHVVCMTQFFGLMWVLTWGLSRYHFDKCDKLNVCSALHFYIVIEEIDLLNVAQTT